jgi:hypothetical protein
MRTKRRVAKDRKAPDVTPSGMGSFLEPMKEPVMKLAVHKCLLQHSTSMNQAGRIRFPEEDATSGAEQLLPVCPGANKNFVSGGGCSPLGTIQGKGVSLGFCCVHRGNLWEPSHLALF